ncbi:ester cyclase [Aquincola tertiaricarbonis]|uniref:ester cyclase n=1 Tax=Aquincola tertiaricarbonis TaxID=391953 RepID=UPI0018DE5997|nr:ester cyclase [Aquincola tertiaricarbonis]
MNVLFREYVAALNAHAFERMSEFMHDEMTVNGRPMSRDQMIVELRSHIAAVPDLTWRTRDVAIEGGRVAAHFLNKGTPVHPWLGLAPNGTTVEYVEHVFHRVRDGRFYEQNFLLDIASIREQLMF